VPKKRGKDKKTRYLRGKNDVNVADSSLVVNESGQQDEDRPGPSSPRSVRSAKSDQSDHSCGHLSVTDAFKRRSPE